MSEIIVSKAGGTSNADAEAVSQSLEWAEESDFFVASAPGKLDGVDGLAGEKVTDLLLTAYKNRRDTEQLSALADVITERYSNIVNGLGIYAMQPWIDTVPLRIAGAVTQGEDQASMLGERLQAEVYESVGFRLIDPSESPYDLGTKREVWREWFDARRGSARKSVVVGNATRDKGQPKTFSRGGSDTTAGFVAYAVGADMHINLTDGGARSADPRILGDRTQHIDHLLYVEGRELGRNGTGLVHPSAMVPLMVGNIPTQIRSTFDKAAPMTELDNNFERAEYRAGRAIALSLMKDVVVIRVREPGMAEGIGRLASFERALANEDVLLVDAQGEGVDAQAYFVHAEDNETSQAVLKDQIDRGGSIDASEPMSLVTLAGYKLEKRLIDNFIHIALNGGFRPNEWQSQGRPFSTGEHSIRLGFDPQDAGNVIDHLHETTIEHSLRI